MGDVRVHGRFLKVKCFLEGIDIPVISAQVQGGVGQACVCNIVIPFNDYAHKLKPRTLVHLFVMDSRWEQGQVKGAGGTTNFKSEEETSAAMLVDANNLHNYKLMFVGEVLAYEYTKVGSIRQITLVCQDFTKYWQDAKLYWGRRNTSLTSYKQAIFSGATQLYRGRSAVDSSNDLVTLLRARPSANKDIPGLLGGLLAALESVTGVFSPDATRKLRGVNDYMSQAELRLHLTRMLGASEQDDTSTTFINSRSFRRYLRRVTRQVKSTASFYDLMGLVLGKCYQVWNSVPGPPYIYESTMKFEYLQRIAGYNFRNDPEVNALYQATEATYNRLTEETQNALMNRRGTDIGEGRIPASADMILNESDGSGGRQRADSSHSGVRTHLGSNWSANPTVASGDTGMTALADRLNGTTATGSARRASRLAGDGVHHASNALDDLATLEDEGIEDGHTSARYSSIRSNLGNALDSFRRAAGATYSRQEVEMQVNSRLHCFMFHPDIYMMPPPKCNVVFPDQVQSIRFSRKWMSEVSRVWLHGRTSSGSNTRTCYFSPNTSILGVADANDGSDVASEAVRQGQGFLMPHEKFTGVVSAIVGLGDNDIFRRLHVSGLAEVRRDAREEATAAGEDTEAIREAADQARTEYTATSELSPTPHMQRAANYMFFENRYNSRELQATLRYSPQLVTGMPCLILDPMHGEKSRMVAGEYSETFEPDTANFAYNPYDSNAAARLQSRRPKGTHYVGILHKVAHVLNSSGGAQTKIILSKVREHNEIHNIWATDSAGTSSAKMVERKRRTARIRPSGSAPGGQNGLSNDGNFLAADMGRVVDGETVYDLEASQILGAQWRSGARYEVNVMRDDSGTPLTTHPVSGPSEDMMSMTYQEPIQLPYVVDPFSGANYCAEGEGTPAVQVVVRRVWYDAIPQNVNFTFEQIARPPWMANIYTANRIGADYYQPMFGCGSILDGNIPILSPEEDFTDFEEDLQEREDTTNAPVGDPYTMIKIEFKVDGGSTVQDVLVPSDLMQPGNTTQAAADALAEVWMGLKEIGADVNRFIDTYTQRSMADIYDILGTVNKGMTWQSATDMTMASPGRWYGNISETDVAAGAGGPVEGFHSWAFGPFTSLMKEDTNGNEVPMTGADERLTTVAPGTEQREVRAETDTRLARHTAVSAYVAEMRNLMGNRTGIAGSGVQTASVATPQPPDGWADTGGDTELA